MAHDGSGHRQRLKKRFLGGDPAAFEEPALLELLLSFAIPRVDVQPLAARLLDTFGSLDATLCADAGTLQQIEGLGKHAAALITLTSYLARRPGSMSPVALPIPVAEIGFPASEAVP